MAEVFFFFFSLLVFFDILVVGIVIRIGWDRISLEDWYGR